MGMTSSTTVFLGMNAFVLIAMLSKDGLLNKIATQDQTSVIALIVLAAIPGVFLFFKEFKAVLRKKLMLSSVRKIVSLLPVENNAIQFIPVTNDSMPDDGELVIMAWTDSAGELLFASEGFVIDGIWKSRGEVCETSPDMWLPLPKTR